MAMRRVPGLLSVLAVLLVLPPAAPAGASQASRAAPSTPASLRADFNGDGAADLAIAAPGEGLGGASGAGVVHVLVGSAGGLTAAGSQLWSQASRGVAGVAEAGDFLGQTLAGADPSGTAGNAGNPAATPAKPSRQTHQTRR